MLEISTLSFIAILVLWVPFVLFAMAWVLTRWQATNGAKRAAVVALALLGYAVPLGDVTVNTIRFRKACENAGVHIYRTVESESLSGNYLSEVDVGLHLYRFVEVMGFDGVTRISRGSDGSVIRVHSDKVTSPYEYSFGDWRSQESGTSMRLDRVIERKSGAVLAESFSYEPRHGWVDQILFVSLGGWGLDGCPNKQERSRNFGFYSLVVLPVGTK